MMKDVFYVLKMLVLTALIVMIAQVHVGQLTLEDHFDSWAKNSILVDYIEEAVDGGIAVAKATYGKADASMQLMFAKISRKHAKRDRGFHFSFKRHDEKADDSNPGALHAGTNAPDPQ